MRDDGKVASLLVVEMCHRNGDATTKVSCHRQPTTSMMMAGTLTNIFASTLFSERVPFLLYIFGSKNYL